jgi:hypothetical protein
MQSSTWANQRGTQVIIHSHNGEVIRADLSDPGQPFHKLAPTSAICNDISAALEAGSNGPTVSFGYKRKN